MDKNASLAKKCLQLLLGERRVYFVFLFIFVFMSLFAPNFFNAYNIGALLGTVMLNGIVVIGFTIVLILGHLDLSTVAIINMSGNLALYLVKKTGSFAIGLLVAAIAGVLVGMLNGFLVTKAKINSFIATLGMSTLLQGIVLYSNNAATRSIRDFSVTDFLDIRWISFLPNRAIVAILIALVMWVFMTRTGIGKNFYLVGGNVEAAWYAGLRTDRYLTAGFMLNGAFAAFGGALYSCYMASAMADIGAQGISPLNTLIAASVLGGASLAGGRGDVLQSFFGVVTLTTLYNGLTCFHLGYEMQIFINGLVLILVVLIEAIGEYRRNKFIGSKSDLFA